MPRLRRNEVERRQHRRRQLFAAGDGGSTAQTYPQTPAAYILLSNGQWLEITTDVRYSNGVSITRGKSATDVRVRPGSCAFTLNNLDGRYSPRNAQSILYGLIGRNTQIKFTNLGSVRFWGEIPEWPPEWTTGGQDAWVTVTAAGRLRRLLASNAPVLDSALKRQMLHGSNSGNVLAYWALEDGVDASQAASAITGGLPMVASATTGSGSVKFGTGTSRTQPTYTGFEVLRVGTGLLASLADGGTLTGAIPAGTLSTVEWTASFIGRDWAFDDGTDGSVLCRLVTPGGTFSYIEVRSNGTTHQTTVVGSDGTVLLTSAFDYVDMSVWRLHCTQVGTNVTTALVINRVHTDTNHVSESLTDTRAGTLAWPRQAICNPNGTVRTRKAITGSANQTADIVVGHLWIGQGLGPMAEESYIDPTSGLVISPWSGYINEPAAQRFQRLCTENGINTVVNGTVSSTAPMGFQDQSRLIDLLYDVEDGDQGLLYEDRSTFGLGYRTQYSMMSQASALPLVYTSSGNVAGTLKPADNDLNVINDSTVTRRGGSSSRFELTVGAMSTADPSAGGIGRYPESVTVNVANDGQLLDMAGWRVNLRTVNEQRFDVINVNLSNMIVNHGLVTLAQQALAVNYGDKISIDNPPIWIPPEQIIALAVGYQERFDQFVTTIAYSTLPASPYNAAVLDDPTLGRLESDGTTLADATLDITTNTFSTNTGTGVLWATNAANPLDFVTLFDVMMAGERMTVQSITGTATPQVWVVTRSVNGVVKTHVAGESITLRYPIRLSR